MKKNEKFLKYESNKEKIIVISPAAAQWNEILKFIRFWQILLSGKEKRKGGVKQRKGLEVRYIIFPSE